LFPCSPLFSLLSPAGSYLTLFPQRWCGLLGRCERQFPGSFELRIAVRLLAGVCPLLRISDLADELGLPVLQGSNQSSCPIQPADLYSLARPATCLHFRVSSIAYRIPHF
jgi:hypothetical protein